MIYTSWFFGPYGDHGDIVSIAAKAPDQYDGERYHRQLWPNWDTLKAYKSTGDEEAYSQDFDLILEELNPHIVGQELSERILLCWEPPGQFCHRHLVAEWLKYHGYEVREL